MSQPDYLISTPENVDLHLELAGVGNRILACLIDTLISWGLILFVALLCGLTIYGLEYAGMPGNVRTIAMYYVIGAAVLLILFINFGYFIYFEGTWQGQTPGKRVTRIRVVESNGQAVSWTSVVIRNLLRVVDSLLFVGLVVVLIDRTERRTGDLAAGTVVIRERLMDGRTGGVMLSPEPRAKTTVDVGPVLPPEYELLVSFLERRAELSRSQRPILAGKLDAYFRERLNQPGSAEEPEHFLESIYASYRSRAGNDI